MPTTGKLGRSVALAYFKLVAAPVFHIKYIFYDLLLLSYATHLLTKAFRPVRAD